MLENPIPLETMQQESTLLQFLVLSIEDQGVWKGTTGNDNFNIFFPGMPVELTLSFQLQTCKSI